jgi:hypothetical protein
MKKLLIPAIVLSLVCIVAFTFSHKTKTVITTETHIDTTAVTTDIPVYDDTILGIDTTGLFDLRAIRARVADPAAMAEAMIIYKNSSDTLKPSEERALYEKALRKYPIPFIYERLAEALHYKSGHMQTIGERAQMMSDSLCWPSGRYIAAAKYALSWHDSTCAVSLLRRAITEDSKAYARIDADNAFHALDNYADYYYMMDSRLKGGAGVRGSLRTMAYASRASFPYTLTPERLFKSYAYIHDTINNTYNSPYILQDDAMRDLVRGNRNGRFSRMTDHSVVYVAALHLSDDFYTYIYADQDRVNRDDRKSATMPDPHDMQEEESEIDAPSEFVILNIDRAGHKLGQQKIGCSCSPIHITTASVDSAGMITVTDMKQTWKKNPLKAGYKGNSVAKRDVTATRYYQVKADGTVVAATSTATAENQDHTKE